MTTPKHAPIRKEFFPVVDGLRTLAVMLVVIFHANYAWLPGGFIGVDIFFVISGFLITRNIVAENEAGTWSFSNFYIRRVARLFPALYATILLTLLGAFLVASPAQLERLGEVAIFTILSVSNIFFWLESGYFDVSASTKPLLHTWSLAVEEQFYLFWPMIIIGLAAIRSRTGVIVGLTLLGILSFAGALYYQSHDPSAVFFLTPFRAYQFAMGGLLGLMVFWNWNRVLLTLLAVGGIAASIAISFLVDGQTSHFLAATVPALAATAAIAGSKTRIMELTIGSKPMVWIGQRSYSIYLAHWPLMVLWKMETGAAYGVLDGIVLIILSVVLGTLLHMLVETRFRFRSKHTRKIKARILMLTAVFGVSAVATGANFWIKDGHPDRVDADLVSIASLDGKWAEKRTAVRAEVCNMTSPPHVADTFAWSIESYNEDVCATIDPDKPNWLVVGDSFAADTYLVMSQAYPEVNFLQATIPGCQLRDPKKIEGQRFANCRTIYERALMKFARLEGLNGIVLSSNWEKGKNFRIDDLLRGYLNSIKLPVIVVGQHIRFSENLPDIILRSRDIGDARLNAANNLLDSPSEINESMIDRFPAGKVKFLDFIALQCPDGVCTSIDDEAGMIYLDDSHLSVSGASLIATRMRAAHPDLMKLTVDALSGANADHTPTQKQRIEYAASIRDLWPVRSEALRNGTCNMMRRAEAPEISWSVADFDRATCVTIDPGKANWLIVGDEFAADAYLVMREAYPEVNFLQVTVPGCPLRQPSRMTEDRFENCRVLYSLALEEIANGEDVDGVVLASDWVKGRIYRIEDIIRNHLNNPSLHIVVVGQHIRFDQPLPRIVSESESLDEAKRRAEESLLDEPSQIDAAMRDRFRQDNVTFLDFIALQCPDWECTVIDDEAGLMYLNNRLLSPAGAGVIGARMRERHPDLLSKD